MSDSAISGTPDQHGVFIPSYGSYNWIGGPADFGLATNTLTGGDSRTENLNKWFQSGDQAYIIVASAMVRNRAQATHSGRALTCQSGTGDGTRSGFLIFWPCTKKVSFVTDVGLYGCWYSHQLPVVFLGVLFDFLCNCHKRLHW